MGIYLIIFILVTISVVNSAIIFYLYKHLKEVKSYRWGELMAKVYKVEEDGKHLSSIALQIGYINNRLDKLEEN